MVFRENLNNCCIFNESDKMMQTMKKEKIGVLGSGIVGKTLAKGFEKFGYEVMIGSGEPDKLEEWKSSEDFKGRTGVFKDTAAFGEIIVLSVKGAGTSHVLQEAGEENINGKIIIDTTNPIADMEPVDGVLNFFTDLDNSLMEQLQNGFSQARFVKAFNSVGASLMIEPDFAEGKPSMFICGNDAAAKKKVAEIVSVFGWEVEDMGSAVAARAIEPLCMLWCIPGFRENKWQHAFKLLRK